MAQTELWIYKEGGFQGDERGPIVDSDKNLWLSGFNNNIESLKVRGDPDGHVKVYDANTWQSTGYIIRPGDYDSADLVNIGIGINTISSFQIYG